MSASNWYPDLTGMPGPKYRAIAERLRDDVASGLLRAGARLPPQREIAKALGVDLTTVTRAFSEARRMGLIQAEGARGSFIRSPSLPGLPNDRGRDSIADFSMNMPPQPARAELRRHIQQGLAQVLGTAEGLHRLQYQASAGVAADRAVAARWLGARLGPVPTERVAITAGAQAAIYAILSMLAEPKDVVCTTPLTYPGLRVAAGQLGVRLIAVAVDQDGMIPGALEDACAAHRPKAIYCIPTMDNPCARTMPIARRQDIADIARRFDTCIIEDDAYGMLPSAPIPAVGSIAPDKTWHISTLSKCLSPALRIAFVVTPGAAEMVRLSAKLRAISLMSPPLMAALATSWIEDGTADSITATIREESRRRQAAARSLLAGFDITGHPEGYHLWLALPSTWSRGAIEAEARQEGLAVVTDEAFAVGSSPHGLRIALGAPSDLQAMECSLRLLVHILEKGPGISPTVV